MHWFSLPPPHFLPRALRAALLWSKADPIAVRICSSAGVPANCPVPPVVYSVRACANQSAALHVSLPRGPLCAQGDSGFPLGGFVKKASEKREADSWKVYFKSARQEMTRRILHKAFVDTEGGGSEPNKWCALTTLFS